MSADRACDCCYVCCEPSAEREVCRCALHRACAEEWVRRSGCTVCAVCGQSFAVALDAFEAPPEDVACRMAWFVFAVLLAWVLVGLFLFQVCPWLLLLLPLYCLCSGVLASAVHLVGD